MNQEKCHRSETRRNTTVDKANERGARKIRESWKMRHGIRKTEERKKERK